MVEDDEGIAAPLAEGLIREGFDVDVVGTGAAALAAPPASLVILDIGLPDIDGYSLARQIRAEDAGVKLVAVTGYGQAEDRAKALAAGFHVHLTKPVQRSDLERALAA